MESKLSRDSHLRQRPLTFWICSFLVIALLLLGAYSLRYDLRSYAVLARFINPQASGPLLRLEILPITSQEIILPIDGSRVRARLYLPTGVAHPHGMVVVHGIHHLGIDEPRLVNFSRAAAEDGFAVLTPEIAALADYTVDASSIPTIGESAVWLQQRLDTGPEIVIGVSFAGSLTLLAARNPQYAAHMRAIVVMGAYDSLAHVAHFLATDQAELPDGQFVHMQAHDYGASVFVYSHMAQFFTAEDVPIAREALRDWLWEEPEKAQPFLAELSPQGRATMESLLMRKIDQIRPQLLDAIAADQSQLASLSPEGKLADLRVPVFILHGSTDDIIPSTESLWLEKEIPASDLRAALITPAFSHVDPDQHAGWIENLRLIRFLGKVLRAAE